MDDLDDIVREFLVESAENLDQLDADLVALESNVGSRELISSIFRTVHTIKGTAGFLAFSRLEAISHTGEAVLVELREGRLTMTSQVTDALLSLVDTIRAILRHIEVDGTEGTGDDSALIAALTAARTPTAAAAELEPAAEPASAAVDESQPPALPSALAPVKPVKIVPKVKTATTPAPPVTPPAASAPVPSADATTPVAEASRAETTVRVDVSVLDDLLRQVGELVLARNQITRLVTSGTDGNDPLLRATHSLDLIASDLQGAVMQARMQPIDHVWSKMPRVVRDLASQCGRLVRLDVSGGDTELDRSLLEAVKDPLTHLVRNAIDHGIESPEVRTAAGKDKTGTLRLAAYHSGGQVIVEVADDGAGIDPAKVRAKAATKGLVTAAEADALTDRQALDLLFLPGFSTAEHVTNVSGRGVGMDVVRTKIEGIGGSVEVESTPGAGTSWRLRIPLTLAIMPGVIVEAGGQTFVTPQVNIAELVKITTTDIETVRGAPVYRLRGDLLTLVLADDVLGYEPSGSPDRVIVVVQVDTTRFGLVVDKVITATEVVVKPLSHHLKAVPLFGGATILGDGALALIFDVQAIARTALGTSSSRTHERDTTVTTAPVRTERLLIARCDGRRLGLPMDGASRLEPVTPDVIEHVGRRLVTQYRGRLMPVTPLGAVVGGMESIGTMLVVYQTPDGSDVAFMVDTIEDIVSDDPTGWTAATGPGLAGATVIGGHVVEIVDLTQAMPAATSRELVNS